MQEFLPLQKLLLIYEVAAAVLLPAVFGAFRAEGFFFAVTDGADAIAGNACAHQRTLHGIGAIVTERQVVFGGTTLIAVAFDGKTNSGMSRQILRGGGDAALLGGTHIVLVVIEVDVFDAPVELLF